MRRVALAVAVMMAAVAVVPSAAQAAPPDLNALIAALTPGATLIVPAGNYTGPVTVGVANVSVLATPGSVTITTPGGYALGVTANGVTVAGFTLAGTPWDAFQAVGVDDVTVRDKVVTAAGSNGFEIRDANRVLIDGANATGVAGTAVRFVNATSVAVQDVTAAGSTRGVHFVQVTDATLDVAHVSGTSEHGIVVEDSRDVAVADATITDGFFGVWVLRSSVVDVARFNVSGVPTSAFGVLVERADNVSFTTGHVANVGDATGNVGNGVESRFVRDAVFAGIDVVAAGSNGFRFASTSHAVVTDVSATDVLRGMHVYDGHHITLTGVALAAVEEHGLVPEASTNVTFTDATVTAARRAAWVRDVTDVAFTDLTASALTDDGVVVETSTRVTFTRPTIGTGAAPTAGNALRFMAGSDLTVIDAVVTGAGANGWRVVGTAGASFTGGTVTSVARGAHLTGATGVTVGSSAFSGLGGDGIVVEDGIDVTVTTNTLTAPALGVWVRGHPAQAGLEVRGNTVTLATVAGVALDHGAMGVTVADNLLRDSLRGVKLVDGSDAPAGSTVTGNVFTGNVFRGNAYHVWTENTSGSNTVFGGSFADVTVCDVWAVGDTAVVLDSVATAKHVTTNDSSKVTLLGTDAKLKTCKGTDDPCDGESGTHGSEKGKGHEKDEGKGHDKDSDAGGFDPDDCCEATHGSEKGKGHDKDQGKGHDKDSNGDCGGDSDNDDDDSDDDDDDDDD